MRLLNYIYEAFDGNLYLKGSINYSVFQDIFLYLDNNTDFLERLQAICDKYRKDFSENHATDILMNSKIFDRFIKDLIESYKKNVRPVEVSVGTERHLMYVIASQMTDKVRSEVDLPKIPEDEEEL